MKKPNQRKARPSYFQQNVQRFGTNFLETKNAEQMQRDAVKVFRDIAMGNINMETDGAYFLHPQFLASCIKEAQSMLNIHIVHCNGGTALIYAGQADEMVRSVLERDQRSAQAYKILYDGLCALSATGDLNYLSVLTNNLRNYRFNI